jgi:hypothetical protein
MPWQDYHWRTHLPGNPEHAPLDLWVKVRLSSNCIFCLLRDTRATCFRAPEFSRATCIWAWAPPTPPLAPTSADYSTCAATLTCTQAAIGRQGKEDEEDEEEEERRRRLTCSRFNFTSRLPPPEARSQSPFGMASQPSKMPAQPQDHLRP